jgi:hypothetical protein
MLTMDFLVDALEAIVLFFQRDDKEWNISRIIIAIVVVIAMIVLGFLIYR